MDEQNKEVETTENDASSSEESQEAVNSQETELEEESVETTETEEESAPIDYEEELRRVKEKLGSKVDKERQKRIEAEKNAISLEDVERIVEERVGIVRNDLMKDQIEALASRMAKSDSEKELALHYFNNRITRTGNFREDLEDAFALANKKKYSSQISELQKTISSKKTISGASEAGAPAKSNKPVRYSQDVIQGSKMAGVSPEEFAKELEKK
jgi:hypothetical protein